MKNHTIRATLPAPDTDRCSVQNLRRPIMGTSLRPVSPPTRICRESGTPIASWTAPDGTATCLFQSDSLALWAIPASADVPVSVGTLPAKATAAVSTTEGIHIFTPDGVYTAAPDADGRWSLTAAYGQYPPIAIFPTEPRIHTAATPRLTLKGDYTSWSGPMDKTDIAMLGSSVMAALSEATAAAVADGCAAAPILAWYRLRDAAGRELFRSTPVMVTPDGIQGPGHVDVSVAVSSGSYRQVQPTAISVTGFRIGLRICDTDIPPASRHAAVLELMTAPAADLVDYSATPYVTRLGHTATEGQLRIAIPRLAGQKALVPAMLDRLDEVSEIAAVIHDPFNPSRELYSTGIIADIPAEFNPGNTAKFLRNAISGHTTSDATTSILREISMPHTFTASVATVAGDITAYGGITPTHTLPMPINAAWIAGKSYGPWQAKVCVTLLNSRGQTERLCAESAGEGPIPEALLPMLSYPHPGASRIDIELTTDGRTLSRSFPLTPTPASAAAYYVEPSLRPIPVSSFESTVSPMRAVTERKPVCHKSSVVVAATASPLIPAGTAAIDSAVTAITESRRSTSGIAFGRRHLYVFTMAGIHTVSVSSSMQMAVSAISSDGVASSEAVAVGPEGVYAATPSGVICLNGTQSTVLHPGAFKSIAWSPSFRELWCLPADGAAKPRPVIIDRFGHTYTRTDIAPKAFCAAPHTLFIASSSGFFNASREYADPDKPIAVSWCMRICVADDTVPRIRALTAVVAANDADLSIDLLGDNGTDKPHRFAGLAVVGGISAPLYLPVIAHPHRYVTISLYGHVSADTRITSFLLQTGQRLIF